MSLKSFHIFFIAISVLTAFGFAAWSGNEYATGGGLGLLAMGVASAAVGIGLVIYGRAFRRKIKELPGLR